VIHTLPQRPALTPSSPDRLTWPVSFAVDAYGMTVGVRASHESARSALQRVIPPGGRATTVTSLDATYSLVVADGSERTHTLYRDDEQTAKSLHLSEIVDALESQLHFQVAVGAKTRLFVHAGVVGWRGGAIVIPGRTYAGKSSLVAALVRAGATYYSDEYAVFDDAGRVHPFARFLGIRDDHGRSHRVDPSLLGAIGHMPLPVSMVIVTRHVADTQWEPTEMTRGETVLALLDNTIAVRARPADALRILTTVAREAAAIRGERGDTSDIIEYLLQH